MNNEPSQCFTQASCPYDTGFTTVSSSLEGQKSTDCLIYIHTTLCDNSNSTNVRLLFSSHVRTGFIWGLWFPSRTLPQEICDKTRDFSKAVKSRARSGLWKRADLCDYVIFVFT